MKKAILLFTTLCVFLAVNAQKKGKQEIVEYTTEDGTHYTLGDTVRFGRGSNPNGNFNHVYVLPDFFVSYARYYDPSLNGKFAIIDKMQNSGSDKMGYTMYFTFRYPAGNSAIRLESAIADGEVVTPASKKKIAEKNQPTIIQNNAPSLAEELKKLKELLDAGVLTQAEFDAQKQKLLNK